MVVLRYLGSSKKRLNWISGKEQFSYIVRPGDVIRIPDSEIMKAMGSAPFEVISEVVVKKPKKVKALPKNQRDPLVEQVIRTEEKSEDVVDVVTKKDLPDPMDVEEDPLEKYNSEPIVEGVPPQALVETEEEEEPEEFLDPEPVEEEEDSPKVDYCSLRKAELKQECKDRGLKVSGNRDDLIARLVMSDIQNNG
jgi:hypothetical protein